MYNPCLGRARSAAHRVGEQMIKLSPGKMAGLNAVSNEHGVIAAAAMDQRGSLLKSLQAARGASADGHDLELFKVLVTDTLTQYASAILLDPEFGLPATQHLHGKGLLLAYEKTGYDSTTPGRLPDLLDTWSVLRLKDAKADCVKILLYYTPFDSPSINDRKHAFIERVGAECRAFDIPFFCEFVGYDADGEKEDSLEYARKKPSIVAGSMQEFSKPQYAIDVLKVEVPVNMTFVQGTKAYKGEAAYTREQALQHFRDTATYTDLPFIYLSAGVSNPVFIETLELAAESKVAFNGVLCGRATWADGVAIFGRDGEAPFREWLNTTGVENIQNVNRALAAATSWREKVEAA